MTTGSTRIHKSVVFVLCLVLILSVYYNQEKISNTTTISEQTWTSKSAPRLLTPLANKDLGEAGKSSAYEELERLWNFVYNRQYDCTKSEYLGKRTPEVVGLIGDGAYDLCVEEQFWPSATSKDYKCLVYSFGIGGDFSFDDEMAKRNCEVHSFDPSENLNDGFVRDSGVTFHKIGIGVVDTNYGFNGWKIRTLSID